MSTNSPGERLPPQITNEELHEYKDGKRRLVDQRLCNKIRNMNNDRKFKNSIKTVEGKTVYFTQEGRAYIISKPVGSGNYGDILLAQNAADGSWAVVKTRSNLPTTRTLGKAYSVRQASIILASFKREREYLGEQKLLKGTIETEDKAGNKTVVNIQPFYFGDDYQHLYDAPEYIDPKKIALMVLKAVGALAELHEIRGYLHRDVNLANLKWDNGECKMMDFGNAHKGYSQIDDYKFGTPGYDAPELNFENMFKPDRVYDHKTDLYSMGVVISKLLEKIEDKTCNEYIQLKKLEEALRSDKDKRPSTRAALKMAIDMAQKINLPAADIESSTRLSEMIRNKAPKRSLPMASPASPRAEGAQPRAQTARKLPPPPSTVVPAEGATDNPLKARPLPSLNAQSTLGKNAPTTTKPAFGISSQGKDSIPSKDKTISGKNTKGHPPRRP